MMDAHEMGRSDGYGWDLGGFGSRDEVRAWLGWAGHTISEAGDRFLADRWGVEPYGDGWYTAIARYNRGAVEGALEQWDESAKSGDSCPCDTCGVRDMGIFCWRCPDGVL